MKVDRALGLLNQALTIDKPRPVPGPEAWWKNTIEYSVDCFGGIPGPSSCTVSATNGPHQKALPVDVTVRGAVGPV